MTINLFCSWIEECRSHRLTEDSVFPSSRSSIAYETYRDRSHEYIVTLFAGVLSREQMQLEMREGPGTQVGLGFTG